MIILISAVFAFVASIISSMLGGGFGLLSIPTIYWIISHYYPLFTHKMQMTMATSAGCSMALGMVSSIKHTKYRNIDFKLYKGIIFYMIFGGFIGNTAVILMNSASLKKIFAIAVFFIAIWMAKFDIEKSKSLNFKNYQFKSISTILGGISAFLGLSIFNVPFFVLAGVKLRKAIGTSTLLVFTYSTIAGIFLICAGLPMYGVSGNHIGYLVLPIFLSTIIPCIIGSLIGAKLVNILDQKILKRIFVSLMFIVSILMFI